MRIEQPSVEGAAQNALLKRPQNLRRERAYSGAEIPILRAILFELGVILAASLTTAAVANLIVLGFGME